MTSRAVMGSMAGIIVMVTVCAGVVPAHSASALRFTQMPFLSRSGNAVTVAFAIRAAPRHVGATISGRCARVATRATGAATRYVATRPAGRLKTGAMYKVTITARRGDRLLRFSRRLYLHGNPRGGI